MKTLCLYLFDVVPIGDDDDEVSTERSVAAVSPIPKIVTTPIKEDFRDEEEDCRDEWGESESEICVFATSVRGRVKIKHSLLLNRRLLVSSIRFGAKAGAETVGPGVDTHQACAERRPAGPQLRQLLCVGVRDRQPS